MTDDSLVTIEVDGQPLQARPGSMLIEATDAAGISVPRFCYHKKLSVAANCRMCLVEVEKAPKPLPACATPVNEGMKVFTKSPLALAAQKGTMEFLLINHPLDCPICDQGGECELQDVAVAYGGDVSRYSEGKRVVKDKDIGPLVATELTRCIHCTRCVRFGAEVAGVRELGATGRGEHMQIGTFIERSVDSELSANIIDLCPVGALTSKPFRYQARAWELQEQASIATHDCVGSNTYAHIRRNELMRVVPRDNESLNESWISDRDRFSYLGLNGEDRLTVPMLKKQGRWEEVSWQEALQAVATALQSSAEQSGALVSASSTLEEMFLLQKLLRGLGSSHIDYRLQQIDFRADSVMPVFPWLGVSVEALEKQQSVLLIGSNIRKDQPILGHRLRKAALAGAQVTFINAAHYEHTFDATHIVTHAARMVAELAAVAAAAGARSSGVAAELIAAARPADAHQQIADSLKQQDESLLLLGMQAMHHPDFAVLLELTRALSEATGSKTGFLPLGANGFGGTLAGAVPMHGVAGTSIETPGKNAAELPLADLKTVILMGVEPQYDLPAGESMLQALASVPTLIALSAWRNEHLEAMADILLPVSVAAETAGSYLNAAAECQSAQGLLAPPGEARPGWKVLRVLGNLLDQEGFEYNSAADVLSEWQAAVADLPADNRIKANTLDALNLQSDDEQAVVRLAELPIYSVDALVRRAGPLQQTRDADQKQLRMNTDLARHYDVQAGDLLRITQNNVQAEFSVCIDDTTTDHCVRLSAAIPGTEQIGGMTGWISLQKVDA
ncbi:MAG: NADH-quinone oxidoreductase subunit NuoG [gamma proteobacterium symbiont of Bathyaustriella thionipta]|nr:NADH-quinone oxidoreductase subunit NuoG [gamma proteobacterium symbiont of Bathyaustriella thionipta]